MARTGRPKTEINYDLVEELAQIQCTLDEISSVMGISRQTLTKDELFNELYQKGLQDGKKSLRRKMYQVAMSGNNTMLIWLSKQYLQMREPKQEIEVDTNKDVVDQISELASKL
jgi:hypothetical protein